MASHVHRAEEMATLRFKEILRGSRGGIPDGAGDTQPPGN